MKNFDWIGFQNGDFEVKCNAKEVMKDFLKECEQRGYLWTSGDNPTTRDYYDDVPIYLDGEGKVLSYGAYIQNDKDHVTWIIEPTLKDKLTWREVFANIQEGETYEYENKFVSYEDGCLKIGDSTGCLSLSEEDLFNIKKKPRLADFQEVQIALNEGKTVKSSFGRFYKLEEAKRLVGSFDLDYWEGCDLTFYEITNEWFIIE